MERFEGELEVDDVDEQEVSWNLPPADIYIIKLVSLSCFTHEEEGRVI